MRHCSFIDQLCERVVGDVEESEVQKFVAEYFDQLPSSENVGFDAFEGMEEIEEKKNCTMTCATGSERTKFRPAPRKHW